MRKPPAAALRAPRRTVTLIELVVVMLLIGVLSALALPRFAEVTAQRRMDAAVRRVQAEFALAQRFARLTGASCTVRFDTGRSLFRIVGMQDPDHPDREYIVELAAPPYEARLLLVNLGGDQDVVFDGFGRPDSSGNIRIGVGRYRIELLLDASNGSLSRGTEW